jgi:GPH family glycoside/pentoside/hexuronide:cation symporter
MSNVQQEARQPVQTPPHPAGAVDEAPPLARLLYASHSFGSSVLSRTQQAWLIFFFAPPAGEQAETIVPRVTLTSILLGLGILDAIDDPLIGYWSDRTRSRWGRRAPFILLATPFYAFFFFLFWTPPDGAVAAAVYIALIVFFQRIAGTLSGGPMEALLPEIARTPASRVSNVAWQFVFGALGAVVGLVATGVIKDVWGFAVMGAIVAVIALVSRYIGLAGVWRHLRRDVEPVRFGIRESFTTVFRNDQFLYFLPTFIFFNMAVLLLTAALPFYADVVILGDRDEMDLDVLGRTFSLGEGSVSSLLFASTIIAVLIALPFVFRLAMKIGKARVYSIAMLLGALAFPLLFFMGLVPGIGVLPQSLIFVALVGLPMAGVFTFPNAILADIADYDAIRTGQRREALYYGAQNVLEKWTGSLMFPIFAGLLLLGETTDNPLGIRLMGPVAGAAALLGYLAFRGYWLPDNVTPETVAREEPGPRII